MLGQLWSPNVQFIIDSTRHLRYVCHHFPKPDARRSVRVSVEHGTLATNHLPKSASDQYAGVIFAAR